ncbi:N-acetylmuramoyl-L-alanine amidase [Paenibacillus marinisediminis]
MDILWKGNVYTNSSDRKGQVPQIIVDHISAGSMSSMDSWFTTSDNKVSSAHYGISKRGDIHQYVAIERAAWAQGITSDKIPHALSEYVRSRSVNPNLYAISIEHEGFDGDLTEEQFRASVWLHQHIQHMVQQIWNTTIPLTPERVIGHYQIDPIRKASCPGPKFPWARLYKELSQATGGDSNMDEMKKELEKLRLAAVRLDERLTSLESMQKMKDIPEWAKPSVNKAVKKGILTNPEQSSFDFYRIITLLDRNGLL